MPARLNQKERSAVSFDLGLMDYKRALDLQVETLKSKINKSIIEDRLLLVEHPSVYTLGRRGGAENLTVSKEFLQEKKIDIVQTDRGGNITYHGPGQVVMYPIVDLERNKIAVKDFVFGLEEIMKRTALEYQVDAKRDERNHGLWVGSSKIGSVGISIKKGVSFHGLALNVNNDLTPFSWINPCGLSNVPMTSIKKEMDKTTHPDRQKISIKNIKASFIRHFTDIFKTTVTNK
jgi:lipoyl(octanoyl) transferase